MKDNFRLLTGKKQSKVRSFWPLPAMLLVGIVCLLTNCSGIDEMRWSEEVWLHDGSFIHVDRYAARLSSGFPDSRRGGIFRQELRYRTLQVFWSDQNVSEQLVSFDVVDGVPYLVAISSQPKSVFCARKKPGDYVAHFYTWSDGRKIEIERAHIPIEVMRYNLSGISQWGRDHASDPTYISWAGVRYATNQPLSGPPMLLTEMFEKKYWLRCE